MFFRLMAGISARVNYGDIFHLFKPFIALAYIALKLSFHCKLAQKKNMPFADKADNLDGHIAAWLRCANCGPALLADSSGNIIASNFHFQILPTNLKEAYYNLHHKEMLKKINFSPAIKGSLIHNCGNGCIARLNYLPNNALNLCEISLEINLSQCKYKQAAVFHFDTSNKAAPVIFSYNKQASKLWQRNKILICNIANKCARNADKHSNYPEFTDFLSPSGRNSANKHLIKASTVKGTGPNDTYLRIEAFPSPGYPSSSYAADIKSAGNKTLGSSASNYTESKAGADFLSGTESSTKNCTGISSPQSQNGTNTQETKAAQPDLEALAASVASLPFYITVYSLPGYIVSYSNKPVGESLMRMRCKISGGSGINCTECSQHDYSMCLLDDCLTAKKPVSKEFAICDKGTDYKYSVAVYPIFENSEIVSIIEIAGRGTGASNFAETHKIADSVPEYELQSSLLTSVINSIPDIFFYKDPKGTYLGSNESFCKLAGCGSVVGKTDFDIFDSDIAYAFSLQDQLVSKKGNVAQSERWLKAPDGARLLLDIMRVPFKLGDTIAGVIGIGRDITEIRRAEKEMHDYRIKLEKHTIELQSQRDQVMRQNEEITQSINYASRIQNAVLPQIEEIEATLSDYFVLLKPRDIVSGDFYWFARQGDKILAAAADCTGHGVPGALMSILGVAFLKQVVASAGLADTGLLLDALRKNIILSLHQTGREGEAADGMDIAIYTVDLSTRKLQFSGAYSPLYHIRDGLLTELKADKMPISLHSIKSNFSTQEIQLLPGDAVYIFSDGYADQFGCANGKKLKRAGFKNIIVEGSFFPMKQQKTILNAKLEEWQGNAEQVDDILIIGARF
jgi:PAS domain S-box-containing protein